MLEALDPDFLYGSYTSAFTMTSINYTAWEAITHTNCSLVYQHSRRGRVPWAERGVIACLVSNWCAETLPSA